MLQNQCVTVISGGVSVGRPFTLFTLSRLAETVGADIRRDPKYHAEEWLAENLAGHKTAPAKDHSGGTISAGLPVPDQRADPQGLLRSCMAIILQGWKAKPSG